MKSQILTLILLIINAFLFQPTHQYRLSKRELTEYDLINFIVGSCSVDKTDMLIQSLCDQTLQSALMGNFPLLLDYCKTTGAGMNYCNIMNQYTMLNQNADAKRFVYRRFVRSVNEDKKLPRKGQETDFEQDLIVQICITNTEKSSSDTEQFCNRTLQEVQRGQYPEIKRLCKYYPDLNYCQYVQSTSSLSFSWPLSESSSLLSSTDSIEPSHLPKSSISKLSSIKSIIGQQRIKNQK